MPISATPIRRENPHTMEQPAPLSAMSACPASPVILATRQARTPLAIADALAPGLPILFANDAFGALLGRAPASFVGQPLAALALSADTRPVPGGTVRLQVAGAGGQAFTAALSTAAVAGADGTPMCLLCSLVDARGDGADEAIERDAGLLAQVARAASDLMKASGLAAGAAPAEDHELVATRIARDAVRRAVPPER